MDELGEGGRIKMEEKWDRSRRDPKNGNPEWTYFCWKKLIYLGLECINHGFAITAF